MGRIRRRRSNRAEPLSDADAARVVENILGKAGLTGSGAALESSRHPKATRCSSSNCFRCSSRAAVLGRVRTAGRRRPTYPNSTIPPTIHALLAARLDALPGPERAIIAPASVIGLSFPEPAVEALAPQALRGEIEQHLGRLASKQLVHAVDDQAAEDAVYRFHHLLIRDAAYQGLLKRSRAQLHEQFVTWADVVNAERGRATDSRRSSATTSSRLIGTDPSSVRSTSTASSSASGRRSDWLLPEHGPSPVATCRLPPTSWTSRRVAADRAPKPAVAAHSDWRGEARIR